MASSLKHWTSSGCKCHSSLSRSNCLNLVPFKSQREGLQLSQRPVHRHPRRLAVEAEGSQTADRGTDAEEIPSTSGSPSGIYSRGKVLLVKLGTYLLCSCTLVMLDSSGHPLQFLL